ncbi:phosphonoacetaldehyde hydrolase [Pararhodospirillum oryzae]|uniref:Phosphonoacetaldehyde hydrolase n=1 Tax=Pararhodospirillum oryzae TaxID=478448 RepID=A0A512H872_9PROT|nr:phosphonoacetaldehyde hydrolase [Pararhodospirillum oryzae]GEO81654.1 phosphonoacetaldehyde hydrolase [Pararhodospirillum oryzae]
MVIPTAQPLVEARVRLVVFDWAGTVIDHGCRAPAAIFQAAFAEAGVPITEAEARAPMGLPKLDHIRAIGGAVQERWRAVHGTPFGEEEARAVYARFLPMQIAVVADYADVIPGAPEVVADLRGRGIRIGSTTGYTRAIMDACVAKAAAQGFAPDAMVCAGDMATGRPGPMMMFRLMIELDAYPPAAVVKVGDTPVDMQEGRNAGAWAIGVTDTGNEIGLTAAELAALPEAERDQRRARAARALIGAGAHQVIRSVADLPTAIALIEARLAAGEKP